MVIQQHVINPIQEVNEYTGYSKVNAFNLQAPCFLHTGQAFRYSPENAFYIFNQQIYFII
jgi:hypothetical protein